MRDRPQKGEQQVEKAERRVNEAGSQDEEQLQAKVDEARKDADDLADALDTMLARKDADVLAASS